MIPEDFERYRPLLMNLAHKGLFNPRLQARLDASDVVQEALLRAHRDFTGFQGTTEAELVGWLCRILRNALTDLIRFNGARIRDPALEVSVMQAVSQSTARFEFPDVMNPSPSGEVVRVEFLIRLARAVEELPEGQREVVILRDLHQMPVADIAAQLGLTEKAVAGRLFWGRRKLRELLAEFESGFGSAHGR